MKISMSTEVALTRMTDSLDEAANVMKQAGFDGIDISMCDDQLDPEKQALPQWKEKIVAEADAVKKAGLEIAQCHLPYFPGHIKKPGDGGYMAYEAFCLPGVIRAVELCGEIGCPVAVLHPYYDETDADNCIEGNVHMVKALIPYLEKHHVKLALENIYCHQYEMSNVSYPEQIMKILNMVDHPLVGTCLDTGHANVFGIDCAQAVRTYGKKLFALHANGNSHRRLTDNHVIPGVMGDGIDYLAFASALKEVGYTGWFNLEIGSGTLPAAAVPAFYALAAAVARELAKMAE